MASLPDAPLITLHRNVWSMGSRVLLQWVVGLRRKLPVLMSELVALCASCPFNYSAGPGHVFIREPISRTIFTKCSVHVTYGCGSDLLWWRGVTLWRYINSEN